MKTQATSTDAYQLIHDGILALARAERHGIRVDVEYCHRIQKKLTRRIEHHHKKLKHSEFYKRWGKLYKSKTNIHSSSQLANLLYSDMQLVPAKTTQSGQGATDEDSLRQLNIPALNHVLEIRKLTKVRDTYLQQFIRETNDDGYMRPSYNLHTVRTFRSSSTNPNFQNIPKRDKEIMRLCRRAILPREEHMLMEADFSALEVMIGACYHQDSTMLEYLRDSTADMHADMAAQIFMLDSINKAIPAHTTLRQAAKNGFVFPQFYGDYYRNNAVGLCRWVGLSIDNTIWQDADGMDIGDGICIGQHMREQGIKSFRSFVNHMEQVEHDFWKRRFREYGQWRKSWVARYRKKGMLRMLTGFRCSGIMSTNEIINYPIQGTAFHCLLSTLIHADRSMQNEQWDTRIVGQIHDSIILDAHPDEVDHITNTLNHIAEKVLPEQWDWIIVPLSIDVDLYPVGSPWVEV